MSPFYFKVVVRKHDWRKWLQDCSEMVWLCHLTAVLGSCLHLYLCSLPSSVTGELPDARRWQLTHQQRQQGVWGHVAYLGARNKNI